MPPESPFVTKHLPSLGVPIFYRLLRPEFVKSNPAPLSANANTRITEDAKDWIKQLDDNEMATNRLINDVIPAFAEELCQKELNENAQDGYGLDIAADFHRCGVNLRHMGLIRTRFWRKLRGTCSMIFHNRKVESNRDFSCQVSRGDQLKILDTTYRISSDNKDEFTDKVIYLDTTYEDDSKNFIDVFAGEVSDDHNSQQVRDVLLAEMIARTMKNLLRLYLRHAAMKMKISVANIQTTLITEFLNIITGSNLHSDKFWSEQLFMGIINRFGTCALSESERKVRAARGCWITLMSTPISFVGYLKVRSFSPAPFPFLRTDLSYRPEAHDRLHRSPFHRNVWDSIDERCHIPPLRHT